MDTHWVDRVTDTHLILQQIAFALDLNLLEPGPSFEAAIGAAPGEDFSTTFAVGFAKKGKSQDTWYVSVEIPFHNCGTDSSGHPKLRAATQPFKLELFGSEFLVCVGKEGTVWFMRLPISCSSWTTIDRHNRMTETPIMYRDGSPIHPEMVHTA